MPWSGLPLPQPLICKPMWQVIVHGKSTESADANLYYLCYTLSSEGIQDVQLKTKPRNMVYIMALRLLLWIISLQ
jgi:hypothetical protein